MENRTGHFQSVAKVVCIAQVAVVSQSHFTSRVVDFYWLTVSAAVSAGGAVAHMAYSNAARRVVSHDIFCKGFTDQPQILMGIEYSVIVDHYSAAFLTAVLQSIKPVIY